MYTIETGRYKGKYSVVYRFDNETRAYLYYKAINIDNGWKKRLRLFGKTIERQLS